MQQPEVEARRWMAQARDDLQFIQWLPGGAPFESFTRGDLGKAVGMAERIVMAAAGLVGS